MKRITLLSLYTVIVCIMPYGIGFKMIIDIRMWIIAALILIFPVMLNSAIKRNLQFDKLDFLLLLYTLLLSVSSFFSFGAKTGLGEIEKQFCYLFLPYYAGRYFIANEKELLKYFYVLGICALVVSLIAIREFYFGKTLTIFDNLMIDNGAKWANSQMEHARQDVFRASATFVHPIWLGIFLLLVMLINWLIVAYKLDKMRIHRVGFVLIQSIFGIIALILTQSRTAFAAFGIVLILIILWNFKRTRQNVILVFFFGTILFATIYLVKNNYTDYYYNTMEANIYSEHAGGNFWARLDIIARSIYFVKEYPNIFGEARVLNSQLNSFLLDADMLNAFLNVFLFKGLVCALLYLIIWFKGFHASFKMSKYSDYGNILLFVLLYLFISDNVSILDFQIKIIYFITIGIVFNKNLKTSLMSNESENDVIRSTIP